MDQKQNSFNNFTLSWVLVITPRLARIGDVRTMRFLPACAAMTLGTEREVWGELWSLCFCGSSMNKHWDQRLASFLTWLRITLTKWIRGKTHLTISTLSWVFLTTPRLARMSDVRMMRFLPAQEWRSELRGVNWDGNYGVFVSADHLWISIEISDWRHS